MRVTILGLSFLAVSVIGQVVRADETEDATFFESKVRPLLITRCFECHSADNSKGGLRLDSRDAILTGGESGAAAVAGMPDGSLLMEVIGHRNGLQMPPKSKMPDSEIAILTEWVKRGLPWPNSKPAEPRPASATAAKQGFTDEQKSFWSFQPIKPHLPPAVRHDISIRSPIDQFLVATLEANNLAYARETNRPTLLRRLSIDLTGLPPTPEEVAEFCADESPDALERAMDRYLASPRYGERWARRWLDVARYADSNGLDENLAYANAYRYRDYVVKAMREDKPFDQFLVEQIAGDLLFAQDDGQRAPSAANPDTFDPLVATGFLCLGAKMLAEDDPVKMQMDIIDEQVDTISRAFMGLTMGCARCHDHKFDPLTAEDYYGLAGVFKSTHTMDTFTVVARWHERPLATAVQQKEYEQLQQIAAGKKSEIEKRKAAATEVLLTDAKGRIADYLLAATREIHLQEQLNAAVPRGNDPSIASLAGAIMLEAEDFARGNVLKDRENYGKEIGVVVNRGESPNFVEYDVEVPQPKLFQLELRYAAAESRPVKLYVNGHLVKPDAAKKVTGTWQPDSQAWFVECFAELNAGRNLVRLEQPDCFPHIDKVLLTPVDEKVAQVATRPESNSGQSTSVLLPSIVRQWVKTLERSRSDSKSIFTAWHQFDRERKLTVDPAVSENGVARLLGESQPASSYELAERYAALFAAADNAWKEMKASAEGKDATFLTDPVLQGAYHLLTDTKGPFNPPNDIEASYPADVVAELKGMRDALKSHEASMPTYPETMAVYDAKPENLKIHLRGSHLTLGREVSRQLPKILTGMQTQELTEGSGRLQLAKWLASPSHPLTSRVMANRLWQWHFGQGLVRSPDNFGLLGDKPSHPELLDWLAHEFATAGTDGDSSPNAWSLKRLHRELISTTAYRQSTEQNPAALLTDPENKLLWRFHRQRMDVEVLRDSLLAISGKLDETPGGTLLPTANRAYVTSTANVNPAIYSADRRSIYLPVVRSALFQVFTAFDFADPSVLSGQRDQTTVAPQALFMMNSEFVLNQSRAIAEQLNSNRELDQTAKIHQLYQKAYSRTASAAEVSRAIGYMDRLTAEFTRDGVDANQIEQRVWTSLARAVLSANEFIYVE